MLRKVGLMAQAESGVIIISKRSKMPLEEQAQAPAYSRGLL